MAEELIDAFAHLEIGGGAGWADDEVLQGLLRVMLEEVLSAEVEGAAQRAWRECVAEAPELRRLRAVAETAAAEAGEQTTAARRASFSVAEGVLLRRTSRNSAGGAGGSGDEEVLVRGFQVNILGRDVRTLCGGTWLNDEVINFWFELLRERSLARAAHGRQAAATAAAAAAFGAFGAPGAPADGGSGGGAAHHDAGLSVASGTIPRAVDASLVAAAAPLPDLFWNSFFCQQLMNEKQGAGKGDSDVYCYGNVRRWSRPATLHRRYPGCVVRSVFDFGRVLWPVHVAGSHWCLAVAFVRARRLCYYDSLGGAAGEEVLRALLQWLQDESHERLGRSLEAVTGGRWELEPRAVTPRQRNSCDCGVFASAAADFLTNSVAHREGKEWPLELDFAQGDMPHFRERMQVRIMQGSGSLAREAGLAWKHG